MSYEFNRDFQIRLLINMLYDHKFYVRANSQLHLTDFGLPACRLILEVVRNYVKRFGKLPPFPTLELEVIRACHDMTGEIETRLGPAELESLAVIMVWIAKTKPSDIDTVYFSERLAEFMLTVRFSQIPQTGGNTLEIVSNVTALQRQINQASGIGVEFVDACTAVPADSNSAQYRFGTGIRQIDDLLGGGLTRSQMGLITACTGVGKTTAMINFMVAAVLAGKHCLFITLELKKYKIVERFQAIAGGITANNMKIPLNRWDEDQRARYNYLLEPGRMKGSMSVIEKIGNCTLADIDRFIYGWKDAKIQAGAKEEDCLMVAVDWLDRISSDGMKRVGRDTSDERVFFHATEGLDEMKSRHNLILWTATQGGKSAEGKEKLSRKDTAFGNSKHHLFDISLGIAPQATAEDKPPVNGDGGPAGMGTENEAIVPNEDEALVELYTPNKEPPCDRNLVFTYMKVREGSMVDQVSVVYQGPTLKMWGSKKQAQVAEDMARRGNLHALYAVAAGGSFR